MTQFHQRRIPGRHFQVAYAAAARARQMRAGRQYGRQRQLHSLVVRAIPHYSGYKRKRNFNRAKPIMRYLHNRSVKSKYHRASAPYYRNRY